MQRFWPMTLVLLVGLVGPIRAEPAAPSAAPPQGLLCRAAVAAAERANGIPAHLLAAISRVESGRRDPVTGDWHPWPWTANAEGQGYFYDTKAQAVAAVRDMQAHGIQSIDVGCGQVNLMDHPDAFASLDLAFDPQVNAAYAGKFLKELVRPDRGLDQGGGAISLGHTGHRRRLPKESAGDVARGVAARRLVPWIPAGACMGGNDWRSGLGRDDRSGVTDDHAACHWRGDSGRARAGRVSGDANQVGGAGAAAAAGEVTAEPNPDSVGLKSDGNATLPYRHGRGV